MELTEDDETTLEKFWLEYSNAWKYSRDHQVDKKTCIEAVEKCEKLGWSWCETNQGVHHTAIVLYLDDVPKYSVNWTPKIGSQIPDWNYLLEYLTLTFEVEGQISFEDESKKSNVIYKPQMPLKDKKAVEDMLLKFPFHKYPNQNSEGNAEKYELVGCNCRDHVEAVLCKVLRDDNQELLKKHLQEIYYKLRKHSAENLLNKFTDWVAHCNLYKYLVFGTHRPSDLIGDEIRIATGRVFRKLYILDGLCQASGVFDPSIKTFGQWVKNVVDAYKRYGKDLTFLLDKYGERYTSLAQFLRTHSLKEWLQLFFKIGKGFFYVPQQVGQAPQKRRDDRPEWAEDLKSDFEKELVDLLENTSNISETNPN